MASTSPVLLILGAGPNIGSHVAKAFLSQGYRVALASRSLTEGKKNDNELNLKLDLSHPETVPAAFSKVEAAFGTAPSVVIHNGAANHFAPPQDPLSTVKLEDFINDINVNATSVLLAAQAATKGFKSLPSTTKKTFIFTGNMLALKALRPAFITFGMTKAASAHLIMSAAEAYKSEGYRFYFADERKSDGSPASSGVDGPAAGATYLHLAEAEKQEQWYYTFVKGSVEYADFGAPKL